MIKINYHSNFEDDDNWERYIGYLFARILEKYNCRTNGNIVELAPGARPKIGIGLSLLGFMGNLYIIEPSRTVLDKIIDQYKSILPNANIIGLECRFKDSVNYLPQNIDAILGNHSLDDMIIGEHLKTSEFIDAFGNSDYQYSQQKLFEKWSELSQDLPELERIKAEVLNDWKNFISKVNPQLLVLAQYESYYYTRTNGFPLPDISAFDVLQGIKSMLVTNDSTVKEVLDSCEAYGDPRLPDNNQNPKYWVVGHPALVRNRFNIPDSYRRLGPEVFVTTDVCESKSKVEPVYINKDLFEEYFNMKFDWKTANKIIKDYFSITLNKNNAKSKKVIGCAYVDKQKDPSEIAMDGNLGSGRAYYIDNNFNIKGEKTPLATSTYEEYNNGMLALSSAIFEAIAANVLSKELETGSFEVLAVLDNGKEYSFKWSNGPWPCGQIVRVDRNGELDRITHLFQNNTEMKRNDLVNSARMFGTLEGEKFVHRILHGTWSAGNISPKGSIIDLETICAVIGRGPQFSFTKKYIDNYFGFEYLGQIKVLGSMAASSLNVDSISAEELEVEMLKARKEKIKLGFVELMGLDSDIAREFDLKISELSGDFERLSRKVFPNFKDMSMDALYCEATSIFDFSNFIRYYPILRRSKYWSFDNALQTLVNQAAAINKENDENIIEEIVRFLSDKNIIVNSKNDFFEALSEGIEFISRYDGLYSEILERYFDRRFIFETNAYVLNENRRYLNFKDNVKLSLMNLYKKGKMIPERISQLMSMIIDACIFKNKSNYRSNIRVFQEGIFAALLDDEGSHHFEFLLFKDIFKSDNKKFVLKINGKPFECTVQDDEKDIIRIVGPKKSNTYFLKGYKSIRLLVNGKVLKFSPISERDTEEYKRNNLAGLFSQKNI